MWGWLGRIFGWAQANIGDPVSSWAQDLIHGLWGWLSSIFGHVGEAWRSIFDAGNWIWIAFQHFGLESLATVWHIIWTRLPAIIRWVARHIAALWVFAKHIWNELGRWVRNLIARIEAAIKFLTNWVIVHIYRPLLNDFLQAWHWITHFGQILWFYITHPDKLAALIFDALIFLLERTAWDIGSRLGKFFLALIVHNLMRFVLLIEDILMAVF